MWKLEIVYHAGCPTLGIAELACTTVFLAVAFESLINVIECILIQEISNQVKAI